MNRRSILFIAAAAGWASPAGQPAGRLVAIAPHSWAWISADDHSANGAVIVGDRAAVVVDPGLTPSKARELLAAARGVTTVPVRYVVLTHWHPDHALGVSCLGATPFRVIAHPNARLALARNGGQVALAIARGVSSGDDKKALVTCHPALPDTMAQTAATLDLGGRSVRLIRPGPAHTDGDLIVWEPTERVLVAGDVFMHRASPDMGEAYPIHWAAVLDSLVKLEPKAVVAGHFGPSTPEDLARFRDYLATLVRRVREQLAAGVAQDSVGARIRMPEFADFAQYPGFHATIADNAAAVARELVARH